MNNNTAEIVKAIRKKHGWTQADMARKLGVDVGTISRWERSTAQPSQLAKRQLDRLNK